MNRIGLDVGTSKIRAVETYEKEGSFHLVSYDLADAPKNLVSLTSDNDLKEQVSFFKEYLSNPKFTTKNIIIGIPESNVFTRVIEMPQISKKELSQSIKWEAEQYIPTPINELTIQYQVLPKSIHDRNKEGAKMEVLLVGVQNKIIQKYVDVFSRAGGNIVGIEPRSMAISRAINIDESSPISIAANIGPDTTDIIIVERGVIRFTRSIPTGTKSLARSIEKDVELEKNQAENYLYSYGLDESKFDGKVKQIIKPVFDVITHEVKRAITFFESRKEGRKIKRVVLCGSGAMIPGILVNFTQNTGVETDLVNPWANLTIDKDQEDLQTLGPVFTSAVGLSIKEL